MPTGPAEFVAASEEVAARLGSGPRADRLRASVSRLASDAERLDRMILALQTAADPLEARRAQKRIGELRALGAPIPEVSETIDALARLGLAGQKAASRLEAAKSQRATILAGLRRLHGAARRLAAAPDEQTAIFDFEAACHGAVAEGDTAVAGETKT